MNVLASAHVYVHPHRHGGARRCGRLTTHGTALAASPNEVCADVNQPQEEEKPMVQSTVTQNRFDPLSGHRFYHLIFLQFGI